jgi:hypothetical protein
MVGAAGKQGARAEIRSGIIPPTEERDPGDPNIWINLPALSGRNEMEDSRRFLDRHPEVAAWKKGSRIWARVKHQNRLDGLEETLYRVQGDILGDEDDLLVDALARGGAQESPDPLARELFEELPPEIQRAVQSELLQNDKPGEPE